MGDDNWKQVTSFLTGAFTVGLVWLLNGLQKSVPDNFTSRRIKNGGDKKCGNCNDEEKKEYVNSNGDNDNDDEDDDDDDDDLSFVDPWNAPLVYVSTQQRRMMRSSMTSMVNIKNNIGELPKRFKREHWPWETIRRRVMASSDDDDDEDNNSDNNNKSNSNSKDDIRQTDDDENDDISIITTEEEKKENKYTTHSKVDSIRTSSGGGSSSSTEDEKKPSVSLDEKELCIGSIFGLDVGGTLAKLVYFEKKTLDSDPLYTRSKREKHYVQAVSAQTVLMARTEDNYNHHPKKEGGGGRGASLSPTRKLRRSNSDDQNKKNAQQKDNTIMNMPTSPERIRRHTLSESHIYQVKNIINVQKESTTIKEEEEVEEEEEEEEMQETSQQKTKKDKKIAEDLRNLYAIRQESLPDDVRQFRHSVDFHSATEKVLDDDIRRCENKDDEKKDVGNSDHDNGNNRNTFHDQTNDESEPFSPSSSSSSCNNFRKRSKSMLDLSAPHDQQTAEALDRFYDFARRLDTHQDSISDIKLSFYCRELGGEFHFISFETRKMKNAMDLIRVNNLHMNIKNMGATGGGAHKFADVWEKELGIGMFKQDELDSLVAGMQFALSTVVGECYTFRPKQDSTTEQTTERAESANTSSHTGSGPNESEQESVKSKNKYKSAEWWTRKVQRDSISYSSAYPYMLVTIGTGVSVLRVDGPRQHERVSGSTIGGGTFWGLMRLLTDVESFHDSMKLAEKGDLSKVDMMVGDIYGDNSEALEKLGLAANIVASSFGKLVSKDDPSKGLTQEDLARALLSLVTNNIGQVAYLNAKLHNTPRIYFVGSFLRENMISQRRLSYAIDYWSKGEMEALFLEHEGYFGALGAFLMSQNIEKRNGGFYQWETNP